MRFWSWVVGLTNTSTPLCSVEIGGEYHDHTGHPYVVLCFARREDTWQGQVVYRSLRGEQFQWVMPCKDFEGTIRVDGKTVKRFTKVER